MIKRLNPSGLLLKGLVLWLTVLVLVQFNVSYAQSPAVQVFCDDNSRFTESPTNITGSVFQVLRPSATQPDYELRWRTQNNTGTTVIPIPSNLNGKLTYSEVSPDGRYVVLEPLEVNIPLVIWKIGTDELALLQLSVSDIKYLGNQPRPESRQVHKLDWVDNQHLKLRYFDLEYPWLDYQIAEKLITVVDQPFEILEGIYTELPFPAINAPLGSSDVAKIFSPQNHYISVFSRMRNEDFTFGSQVQIYDINTLELVADFTSHADRVLNALLWTPTESSLFLAYSLPSSPIIGKTEITQSVSSEQFQENRNLFNALEGFFGSGIMLSSTSLAWSLSPSGNILALHMYEPQQNQYYVVTYTLSTGEIRAICDIGYPSSELSYAVWSPDERYFGYWNDPIRLFDLTNGHRYMLNGEGFIGWVNSVSVQRS